MNGSQEVKNIVLVHGGFVDGSGWQGVYGHLTADGYRVAIVQNPTLSLAGDVAATHLILDGLDGPAVLVGHSYGGAIITEAGTHSNVAALVEAAMLTGGDAAAAAHVAAARECGLDRLSPRLRLVVLASEAIAEPHTDSAALEEAISEPGNDRWPFDLARIQLAYGSHLRRGKRTTDAQRQLAGAAEIFHRLGATPWAARAEGELRATGITVTKADAGLASLTPQQRQSPCSPPRATPTRRSPPASSSPRGPSPPTCTRCFLSSASPHGPPCATPSPTSRPNDLRFQALPTMMPCFCIVTHRSP